MQTEQTLATTISPPRSPPIAWITVGVAMLVYAMLGNYLVLPGYRRFLEQGAASSSDAGLSLALIWGAARTILWMLSFQIGSMCLSYAVLKSLGPSAASFRRYFLIAVGAWVIVWSIQDLPGPYRIYFATIGAIILALISAAFIRMATTPAIQRNAHPQSALDPRWLTTSFFFFAIATWEMCGLGSVGGILRPGEELQIANAPLVVSQTTKLILELALAWACVLLATTTHAAQRR